MRVVVQRVSRASVTIGDRVAGAIEQGMLVETGKRKVGVRTYIPVYSIDASKLPEREPWRVTSCHLVDGQHDNGVVDDMTGDTPEPSVDPSETKKEGALQEFFGGEPTREPEQDTRTLEQKKASLALKAGGNDALAATVAAARKI